MITDFLTLGYLREAREARANRSEAIEREVARDAAPAEAQAHAEAQDAKRGARRNKVSATMGMAAIADSVFDVVQGVVLLVAPKSMLADGKNSLFLLILCSWLGFGEAVGDVVVFIIDLLLDQNAYVLGWIVWVLTSAEVLLAMYWSWVTPDTRLVCLLYLALFFLNSLIGVAQTMCRCFVYVLCNLFFCGLCI